MANVLVLANETIGGGELLDARPRRATSRATRASTSSSRRAARATATSSTTRRCATPRRCASTSRSRSCASEGIEGTGEVGDADPFNAATDAIGAHGIDEIIISTLPGRDLGLAAARPARAARERDRPAGQAHRGRRRLRGPAVRRHARAGQPDRRAAASSSSTSRSSTRRGRTASSSSCRRTRATAAPSAPRASASRTLLESLEADGIVAAGMIGDPDPYTAAMNALAVLPHLRGRGLDAALQPLRVGREGPRREARAHSGKPVEHVEARAETPAPDGSRLGQPARHGAHGSHAGVHDEHHHGPPEANRSSRVEPQLLGMLLFIISEVMVFGAFFTAYFFIRVVNGDEWPAAGTELPKLIAGVNTAILLSSSLTMHWALESAQVRQPLRAAGRHPHDASASARRSCSSRSTSTSTSASRRRTPRRASIFYGLTGLHGAHVAIGLTLLAIDDGPRLPRALHARGAPRRRGAGHLLALRRRDVGHRLH